MIDLRSDTVTKPTPGMLAAMTAATTAVAALAFLIPLGWELRSDNRDQAMATAERHSATVAGAIAAGRRSGPSRSGGCCAGVRRGFKRSVGEPAKLAGAIVKPLVPQLEAQ